MAAIVSAVSRPSVYTVRAKIPPVTKRVLEVAGFVKSNPGCSRDAVCKAFRCAARTAGIHLQAGKLNGLVRCDSRGRYSKWWPV